MAQLAVLGDDSGPGYHAESHWAAQDGLGQYWVRDMEGAKVYAGNGEYLGRVGRSGEGPLEFRAAGPTYTDSAGFVHLFDRRNRRETVVGPGFSLVRDRTFESNYFYEAVPLGNGNGVVINTLVRSPTGIGFPLHVIEGTTIQRSFGSVEEGAYGIGMGHMLRRLAVDRSGLVYAGRYFEYAIDVWRQTGERLLGLKRTGLWEPPPGGQPQPLSPENPPGGLLLAIWPDEMDRLWVVTWVPRPDWRRNVTEIPRPDGSVDIRPNNSNASLYRSVIEVVDLQSGRLVARAEFEDLIEGFMSEGLIYGNRFDESGEPRLVVWRMDTTGRLAENTKGMR